MCWVKARVNGARDSQRPEPQAYESVSSCAGPMHRARLGDCPISEATIQILTLAATALWHRSVLRFSFAYGLRAHAKLNPRTPLTPFPNHVRGRGSPSSPVASTHANVRVRESPSPYIMENAGFSMMQRGGGQRRPSRSFKHSVPTIRAIYIHRGPI